MAHPISMSKKACDNYHLMIMHHAMKEKRSSREDEGLDSLLYLDGEIFPMDNGYWSKFEAWRVDPEPHVPHGVRHCLTLHDRYNRRVLGFDNAHAIRSAKKGYAALKITWDHRHNREKLLPYEYASAGQLLEDSGVRSNGSWERNERKQHESKSTPHRHHALSGLQEAVPGHRPR